MLGGVPAGGPAEPAITLCTLDQEVLGLHVAARDFIWQIGYAQLHRGDLRPAEIFFIERGGDDAKAGQQLVELYPCPIGTAKEAFEIGSRADSVASLPALDQRRASEEQPVFGTRKPEAAIAAFT